MYLDRNKTITKSKTITNSQIFELFDGVVK